MSESGSINEELDYEEEDEYLEDFEDHHTPIVSYDEAAYQVPRARMSTTQPLTSSTPIPAIAPEPLARTGAGPSQRAHRDLEEDLQYSDDFEESHFISDGAADQASASTKLGTNFNNSSSTARNVSFASPSAQLPPPTNPPLVSMPTSTRPLLGIHAIQAEIALDELSKEVIRLRSEQKAILRQRRATAVEKKERSQKRREEYEAQVEQLKENASKSHREVSGLSARLKEALLEVSYLKDETASLNASLNLATSTLQGRTEQLEESQRTCAELQSKIENSTVKWKVEKENLKDECIRANLMMAVMHKSSELNEERLRRDRENLPEHHTRRLEEELRRVAEKEAYATDRLAVLEVDAQKRAAAVETLRQEAARDLTHGRLRLDSEAAEMREIMLRRQEAFEKERASLLAATERESNAIQITKVSLVSKEHDLRTREDALVHRAQELEMHVQTLEPSLRSAERERQVALATIDESEKKLLKLLDRENAIFEAERGLKARELAAEEAMDLAMELKMSTTKAALRVKRDLEKLESQKLGVNSERFRLHTSAMEMSRQMLVIKQALSHVLRQERAFSVVNGIDSGKALSMSSRAYNYSSSERCEPGDSTDPVVANILYALNSASSSLVALAHNLINPKDMHLHLPIPTNASTGLEANQHSDEPIDTNAFGSSPDIAQHYQLVAPLKDRNFSSSRESVRFSKSAEFDDLHVQNSVFAAAESVRDVQNVAMRYLSSI